MSRPVALTKLSKKALAEVIGSFDNVFCDCDGVLFLVQKPIENAGNTIMEFKRLKKNVTFVTNNTTMNREVFAATLRMLGIDLETEDIVTPTRALVDKLKGMNFDKKLYVISLPALKTELKAAGFQISNEYKHEFVEMGRNAFLEKILEPVDRTVGAVVVCFDYNINYFALHKAYKYLQNPEVLFLATGIDEKLVISENEYAIGPAHFHSLLGKMTGRQPTIMGKPMQEFKEYLKNLVKSEPKRTLFIGDSMEQDMRFASDLGYQKLLVLTGNTKIEELQSCDKYISPDYILPSLGDLFELLKDM